MRYSLYVLGMLVGCWASGVTLAQVAVTPPTSADVRAEFAQGGTPNPAAFAAFLDYIGQRSFVNVIDLMDADDMRAALSDDGLAADALWETAEARTGASGLIVFPAGKFLFTQTLHFNKRLHVVGQAFHQQSGATESNRPTVFSFAPGQHGIVIHRYNTDSESAGPNRNLVAGTDRGDGSIVQSIDLVGGGGSAGHGIWLRARATILNCSCSGFAQNGLHINADVHARGEGYGNANNWIVRDCKFFSNKGHGMYVNGGDANAGAAYSVSAQSNEGSGIYDSSFLGNCYVGCHTATNGRWARCYHQGRRYSATDQVDGTTEPKPGMSWSAGDPWQDLGEGVVHQIFPQWQAGTAYTYQSGYVSDGASSRNVFLGCYAENDQAECLMTSNDVVLGGLQAAGIRNAFFLDGKTVKSSMEWAPREDDSVAGMKVRVRSAADQLLNFTHAADHPQGLSLGINSAGNYAFYHGNLSSRTGLAFLSDSNDLAFGRPSGDSHTSGTAHMPLGMVLGSGRDGRHITYAVEAPSSGEHARGEIVYHSAPTAGGNVGWVCVVGGEPGEWKTFGAIAP